MVPSVDSHHTLTAARGPVLWGGMVDISGE